MPSEFEGRVALITGGGRGLGAAFGTALAERGAHVVLVDVDAEAAEVAAADIRAHGHDAVGLPCDVADEQQVDDVVKELVGRHGGIDVLINNAGLHSAEYSAPMEQLGLAKLRRLFDVNVMGTVVCTLAVRSAMAGRQGACILNVSSAAAYLAGGAYGVSKLAVRGLTIAFAREFGADGIRVNGVAPGLMLTDTIRAEMPPEPLARVRAQQFLPLDGAETDIVAAMLYLCSESARFVTGETLRVSAGFTVSI